MQGTQSVSSYLNPYLQATWYYFGAGGSIAKS